MKQGYFQQTLMLFITNQEITRTETWIKDDIFFRKININLK